MSISLVNVFNGTDDIATWGAAGRIPAAACEPDGSIIVVASECRLGHSGDITKGNNTKIGLKRSTDGGVTWGAVIYAIDLWSGGDASGDPCMARDGAGRYWIFATSTVGLSNGQSPFAMRTPIVYTYSDDKGVTWAPVQQMTPITDMVVNVVSSGTGFYDAVSDTTVIPMYGTVGSIYQPRALYKVGDGGWTYGSIVPADIAQGESRIIKDGDYWYCLTRTTDPQIGRYLYRSASLDDTWERVTDAFELNDVANNLGLCVTSLGGVPAWLYTSSDYPHKLVGPVPIEPRAVRRMGKLKLSVNRGRTWSDCVRLTNEGRGVPDTTNHFGYSCVVASDDAVYCAWESANYTQINFCRVMKSEMLAGVSIAI